MLCGIQADCRIINYPCNEAVGICNIISDLGKCMFFSVTTFSTVGYGNYVPLGTSSMIFSAIHMILGVGLCALWTGCMLRKLLRSICIRMCIMTIENINEGYYESKYCYFFDWLF